MARCVTIRYRRVFEVSLPEAYAWLTDYQDDDAERTSAIVKHRPVVERGPDRVVLEGTIEVLGKRSTGRAEVRLHPPDRWEARFRNGSVYAYHLTPHPSGCMLHVTYRVRVRRLSRLVVLRLLKPLVLREIRTMWDGFAASMRREVAQEREARETRSAIVFPRA